MISASLKLMKYNAQKLVLILKLNVNNEKILLQYSLEAEMSNTVVDCKKVIIVIAVKSVRSKI
jgi:hypothetical protein